MENTELLINQMKILTERLEKLSPDSSWARRASGVRGTLLKLLPELESTLVNGEGANESADTKLDYVNYLLDRGYELIESAAQEY